MGNYTVSLMKHTVCSCRMKMANRRMAALVCMAGVLPVVVLGLQTGGNGAFKQREARGDLRRAAEKPLIVDNERSVKKFGRTRII